VKISLQRRATRKKTKGICGKSALTHYRGEKKKNFAGPEIRGEREKGPMISGRYFSDEYGKGRGTRNKKE